MGSYTKNLNLFKAAKTDEADIEKAASNNFEVLDGAFGSLASNTAQIETAGKATSAHTAGEYVMISNVLYKVTADVSAGTAWKIGIAGASGVNVEACNVGKELNLLKSSFKIKSMEWQATIKPFNNNNNGLTTISVPVPSPQIDSGYTFCSWVTASSIGWVCGLYFDNPTGIDCVLWSNTCSLQEEGIYGIRLTYSEVKI